jgi:hypothetical protein
LSVERRAVGPRKADNKSWKALFSCRESVLLSLSRLFFHFPSRVRAEEKKTKADMCERRGLLGPRFGAAAIINRALKNTERSGPLAFTARGL